MSCFTTIARWQLLSNGGSLLSSLCHILFQLSLRAMYGTDRNAGLSRNCAHAQASRQQWRNFGPSDILGVACSGRCESGGVGSSWFTCTAKRRAFRNAQSEQAVYRCFRRGATESTTVMDEIRGDAGRANVSCVGTR